MLAPKPANDHAASAEASGVPETLTAHAHGAGKAEMRDAALLRLRRDVIVAATLTAPVFLVEMGAHLIPAFHHWLSATLGTWNWVAQFVLVSLVLFGPGLRFFRSGIPAFLRGAPDMNALVALGAGAAWVYSSVATFWPSVLPVGTANVYFEAAGVIVTLILLGRLLEARARGKAGAAIRALMDLQPKRATLAHRRQGRRCGPSSEIARRRPRARPPRRAGRRSTAWSWRARPSSTRR